MTKAASSASDFIAALATQHDFFEVGGVTFELRPLEWAEVQVLNGKYNADQAEASFQMAYMSIVAPQLEEAQFRKAPAGMVAKIIARVAQISGITEDSGPLAGTGS